MHFSKLFHQINILIFTSQYHRKKGWLSNVGSPSPHSSLNRMLICFYGYMPNPSYFCAAQLHLTWMSSITFWHQIRGKLQSFWWTGCSSLQTSTTEDCKGERRKSAVTERYSSNQKPQNHHRFYHHNLALLNELFIVSAYSGMVWSSSTGHQANTSQVLVELTQTPVICPSIKAHSVLLEGQVGLGASSKAAMEKKK